MYSNSQPETPLLYSWHCTYTISRVPALGTEYRCYTCDYVYEYSANFPVALTLNFSNPWALIPNGAHEYEFQHFCYQVNKSTCVTTILVNDYRPSVSHCESDCQMFRNLVFDGRKYTEGKAFKNCKTPEFNTD